MKRIHPISLSIIALILLLCANNIQWGKDYWKNIIVSDGKGYYSYLPAVFIYQDLNFSFADKIEAEYFNENTSYEYRVYHGENRTNKYYAGTALAISPFFLIAHGWSMLFDYPADGFSKLYAIANNFAAIAYLLLGLFFIQKLLDKLKFKKWIITLLIFGFTFGTNLFYYVLIEPCMSHVYSFAFISMLLYLLYRYFENANTKTLKLIGFCLGIILLIRPINALALFSIPFIAGDWKRLKKGVLFALQPLQIISAIFPLLLMLSIQLIIYKIQTGSFFIDTYSIEHFNWNDSHFFDILFSYKKGLFVYTPLCFIALLGFIPLFKEKRFQFFSLLSFLVLLTYVFS